MKEYIKGANPYMPLWEHVPDGEPRVFEYNGEKRVYIYGSHDIAKTQYCGPDQVVWSAPVDDLTNWTYHGVCYTSTDGSILYAPDCVQKGDTFYLYAAEGQGSRIMVATSKTPWGPFTNPVRTELGFDPGILVDDDGRVYAFWGFCGSHCAELNDDMATIKEGTYRAHPLGHCDAEWAREDGHLDLVASFFEASSPRKINGKYVYVYSRRVCNPVPELGIDFKCNGFLSYAVSDSPLDGYEFVGDISFNGGEILKNEDGTGTMTYQWGNNHGSLMQVNGKWYIFYHRQTGLNEFSRQAMLEPVDVAMDKNGKIFIGDVTYVDGEPVSSKPVEMTSQGAHINGLDAYKMISAGYACHIFGSKKRAYIAPVYEQVDTVSAPVMDITNGTTVGFRYLQFGANAPATVTADITAEADLTVNIRIDSYKGKVVATLNLANGETTKTAPMCDAVIGKHAVYFEFVSEAEGTVASFDKFTFDR